MESAQKDIPLHIEKYFRAVFDNTLDSMLLMTVEGVIIDANKQLLRSIHLQKSLAYMLGIFYLGHSLGINKH